MVLDASFHFVQHDEVVTDVTLSAAKELKASSPALLLRRRDSIRGVIG